MTADPRDPDAPCPWIVFDGETYPTVTHALCAAQVRDSATCGCRTKFYRAWIREAPSADMARARVKTLHRKRRADWDQIQETIWRDLLRQQFSPNRTPNYLSALILLEDQDVGSDLRGQILRELRVDYVMEIGR